MIGFESKTGNNKKYSKIGYLKECTRKSVRHSWFELGKDLKKEANEEIKRKPKGGRTYWVRPIVKTTSGRSRGSSFAKGKRRRHVASAPGETHANMFGALRRSLSWIVAGNSMNMSFGYGFSTTAKNKIPPYGGAIEFGRKDGSIAARPSVKNAIDATQRNTQRDFDRAILKEFERV